MERKDAIYEWNYEYLMETDANALYSPVKKMIYTFCKRQKSNEAKDCMTVSGNGFMIPTQNYDDYVQSVYCELLNLCIEHPNDSFKESLILATKKGMYNQFKNSHNRITWKEKRIKEEEKTYYKVVEMLDYDSCIDIASAYNEIEELETETDRKNMIRDALLKASPKVKQYCYDYLNGLTFKGIAVKYGITEQAVSQAIKRLK